MAKARGFLIHREQLCNKLLLPSLPLSPKANPASPTVKIFLAALISLSSIFLQEEHSQILSLSFNPLLICPQQLHLLEEGKKRSISKSSRPYHSALYLSFLKKSPQFESAIDLANEVLLHAFNIKTFNCYCLVFAY
jgi:hypothetical protein